MIRPGRSFNLAILDLSVLMCRAQNQDCGRQARKAINFQPQPFVHGGSKKIGAIAETGRVDWRLEKYTGTETRSWTRATRVSVLSTREEWDTGTERGGIRFSGCM